MADGLPPALSGGANVSLLDAAGHTAIYGGSAAALATVMAFPVALLAIRHSGRVRQILERSTYLVLGMPGVVVAFALSYFTERYLAGLGYGTSVLLIACYAIMFFPLALVGVKASLVRAPVSLDEVARSLGQPRLRVLFRVTVRLAGPGLVAAFCLVFLSAVTELTATLAPHPHRHADAGHAVLGLSVQPLLQPGRAVRPRDDHRRGRAKLCSGPVLQSPRSSARMSTCGKSRLPACIRLSAPTRS